MENIDIILIEPQIPGNIGAIARSMKNFGFKQLILINPCTIDQEAKNRAKHAQEILENAIILQNINQLTQDTLIGTTAISGKDYNLIRSPMIPEELTQLQGKIGLIFGREDTGLRNEELQKLDFAIKIPTNEEYPTLNLSHAATILMYEFSKDKYKQKLRQKHKFAGNKEKEIFLQELNNAINQLSFRTPHEIETQQKVWKKIIGKSMATQREILAMIGLIKKLKPNNSKNSKQNQPPKKTKQN